jgi:hypothetical protein
LVAQVEHEADGCPPWQAGSEIVVGTTTYALAAVGLAEVVAPDASHVRRQAMARQTSPTPRRGAAYVWLRQVRRRRPSEAAKAARAALLQERRLLERLGRMPGIPQLPRLDDPLAATTTLAVAWPASKLQQGPSETLADMFGSAAARDDEELRQVRLLAGLAGVCITLGRLHGRQGVAHRQLTPDGLIRQDDGRLVLRDLGLAARTPGRGEAPTPYQAPEQRSGSAGPRPGPATDVYQVAALAYHLLTGCVPIGGQARPVHDLAPSVPPSAAEAIDAALTPPPDQRPEITALAVALRTRAPAPAPAPSPATATAAEATGVETG